MYFLMWGMLLVIFAYSIDESRFRDDQGQTAVCTDAVELVVGVTAPVALAVLFAPDLRAERLPSRCYALSAGRLDVRHAQLVGERRHDQDLTAGLAHDGFGHRTQQPASDAVSAVRADDDQVRFEHLRQLRERKDRRFEQHVGEDTNARVTKARQACQLAVEVLDQLRSQLFQAGDW